MSNIGISVIIPVKNGQRFLELLLARVFSQRIKIPFEVIIVDSGSTDNTRTIAAGYPVRIYSIAEEDFNHGLTRNFVISKAKGTYIILLTVDALPYNENWMIKLIENLERDPAVAGAYSRQIPREDANPITKIRVNRFFTASVVRRESKIENLAEFELLAPHEKHLLCNFDNVSSCIRRDIWEKIPFPKTNFGEDIEWAMQVLRAGYKIVYDPESIVYHSHDFSPWQWYKKNRVNSHKLCVLFGPHGTRSIPQLIVNVFANTSRDLYCLYKNQRRFKNFLASVYLVPLGAIFGAWGQYIGNRDTFRL